MFKLIQPRPHCIDSLAITEAQWQTLLSDPSTSAPYRGAERRDGDREPYRQIGQLLLSLGRKPSRFLIRTRDVSACGVGFLHSQPLRRGTRCELVLLTLHQKVHRGKGTVAGCIGCGDGLWRIGVRLDGVLEGGDFIPPQRPPRRGP